MKLRHWRDTPAPVPSEKRSFPWSRYALIAFLLFAAAYVAVPAVTSIYADGLVQGRLAPVTSLYRARIVRADVLCDQEVRKGQTLAVVSNFLLNADYVENRQKNLNALAVERVTQSDALYLAKIEEETAQEKYDAAAINAAKDKTLFGDYDKAYRAGAIGQVPLEEARSAWLAAEAAARADADELATAKARTRGLLLGGNAKMRAFAGEARRLDALASRVQAENLTAPISGRIVECAGGMAHADQVVEPGASLYKIFETNAAYVLAFFNPLAARDVRPGDEARVTIEGIDRPLIGRVRALLPSQTKLPVVLEKFIWQKEQWSSYRQIQITFDDLDPALRAQLMYNAKAKVTIRRRAWPRV